MAWRPGQRAAHLELEAPYEDVPDHLFGHLLDWLTVLLNSAEIIYGLGAHLRLSMPDPRRGTVQRDRAQVTLRHHIVNDRVAMLDAIEWVLNHYGNDLGRIADELEEILATGNSAYRVRADHQGLEMRTTPEVRDVVQTTVAEATGSAGEHLATAWNEAYGRNPDPGKAYSEAIKAVEAAAAPVVSPKHLKATLGTIIGDIKSVPQKWSFAIARPNGDSVEDVHRLMSLLWEGQTSRHGGVNLTVPETLEAARAAVHVAATLVQFFVGKSFA